MSGTLPWKLFLSARRPDKITIAGKERKPKTNGKYPNVYVYGLKKQGDRFQHDDLGLSNLRLSKVSGEVVKGHFRYMVVFPNTI